jgi:predicted negative regulator of RcsB-dependent stress response
MPIVTLVLLGVSGVIGYRVWQEYKAKEDALEMQISKKNASETNNSLKDETSLTDMSRLPT